MATTLLEIKEDVYDILGEPADSTVYPEDMINRLINEGQWNSTLGTRLSFLEARTNLDIAADTALDGAITTASATIDLDSTTNAPSSGAILVENDIISYSAISTNTLTVTGITVGHADDTTVKYLYKLPTDCDLPYKVRIDVTDYEFMNEDEIDDTKVKIHMLAGVAYMELPAQDTTNKLTLFYFKKPSEMTSAVDATIPDEFARAVLVPYASGKAYLYRDEAQKSEIFMNEYMFENNKMMTRHSKKTNLKKGRIKSSIKVRHSYNA